MYGLVSLRCWLTCSSILIFLVLDHAAFVAVPHLYLCAILYIPFWWYFYVFQLKEPEMVGKNFSFSCAKVIEWKISWCASCTRPIVRLKSCALVGLCKEWGSCVASRSYEKAVTDHVTRWMYIIQRYTWIYERYGNNENRTCLRLLYGWHFIIQG